MSTDYSSKFDNHNYLNIQIQNDNIATPIPAYYKTTFTQSYMEEGYKYNLGVARFRVPISNLPYFIFKVTDDPLDNTNPNYGVYSFTLTHTPTNTDYTQHIIFEQMNFNVPVPKSPSQNGGKQVDSIYYYIYNVSQWITLMNKALSDAFNALIAIHAVPQTEPPFIFWLIENNKISFIVQYSYTSGEIDISFNRELKIFFDGFTYVTYPQSPLIKYGTFVISVLPKFMNGFTTFGTLPALPPAYLELSQNYSTLEKWSTLRAIVFKTSLIPIKYENATVTNDSGILTDDPILTDFNVTGYYGNRDDLIFNLQSPMRLIDITTNGILRDVDISVFWKDKDAILRQLDIVKGEFLTIKLAFIKKGLVN